MTVVVLARRNEYYKKHLYIFREDIIRDIIVIMITIKITDFIFSDGSSIRVFCVYWSEVTEEKRNIGDNFTLDLSLNEYLDWINNEAYN